MLGSNVKHYRELGGMTQKQLAEKLGVHQSMVAQIERGSKAAAHPILAEMSEIFGVTMDNLVKGNPKINPQ